MLRFLSDLTVPFTNNVAEQAACIDVAAAPPLRRLPLSRRSRQLRRDPIAPRHGEKAGLEDARHPRRQPPSGCSPTSRAHDTVRQTWLVTFRWVGVSAIARTAGILLHCGKWSDWP